MYVKMCIYPHINLNTLVGELLEYSKNIAVIYNFGVVILQVLDLGALPG